MVRRDAFIEAAQRLMVTEGYEQMSIQDVLDELEASRGAFYHYFDSKQALLEAVIDRMVDAGLAVATAAVDDPALPAVVKLQELFGTIGRWKTERRALILSLLTVWMSDDNAVVREKFRRTMAWRLVPALARIIQQGIDEGAFTVESATETARVVVLLLVGLQDVATELFIERQAGRIEPADVEHALRNFTAAFERILGAPDGSIDLMDRAVFRAWFG